MKKAFITGSSSGIGLALANLFLEKGFLVEGLSRSCSIEHDNYLHHYIDLSEIDKVSAFEFSSLEKASEAILINNAGWIGEVKPVGKLLSKSIENLVSINLTAPSILMNSFLADVEGLAIDKTIVNISSGAANSPIKSWAGYCSSKAALDMFSKVVQEEQPKVKVMSIAPGVVDTDMQNVIRNVPEKDFELVSKFKDYHASGELKSPEKIAAIIGKLIETKEKAPSTVFSLRDLYI